MEGRKSQIATSIEQSKRLLEAGIAKTSCDMEWINVEVWDSEEKKMVGKWFLNSNPCLTTKHPKYVPAWSLSRLIDLIAETGIPMNYGPMKDSADVLECAVRLLEYELEDANH